MKNTLAFLTLSLLISSAAFAKIVQDDETYYVEGKEGKHALMNVNEMIKKKSISKIKLYGEGKANLISFSKDDGPVKLYSVDEKGFIYSIEPFASYTVADVYADGKFKFKEAPKRKYTVDSKGFFFY